MTSRVDRAGDERHRPSAERARDGQIPAQERVLVGIREAILSGALEPGTRLRQETLARSFGTSRIPVREALRALEHEGLVSSEPNRGFTVTSLDADDIDDILELLTLLEGHAVRLAVGLMTDDDLRDLQELLTDLDAAERADERQAARTRLDARLYGITGKRRLQALIASLRHEVMRVTGTMATRRADAADAELYQAVSTGDTGRAVALIAARNEGLKELGRRHLREVAGRSRAERRSSH